VIPQQDDADLGLVNIKGDSAHATGKGDHFFVTNVGQASDGGDTGGNSGDHPDFMDGKAWREILAALV
jgi:hypothetical protein